MKFWILWGFDALVACVVLYFFVVGLWDGSVRAFNIGLWMAVLLAVGAVLVGSILLKYGGFTVAAWILMAFMALPSLLFGLFFLVLILLHPKWN
jgi:hypothetical protein